VSEPDLAALRREYAEDGLTETDLEPTPIAMFRRWMADAIAASLHEPNAMVVATADSDGRPSARLVLLKGLDDRGFVFYTNYESRKAAEIEANPQVALLFPWHDLQRQVRIEGTASRVEAAQTASYFASRPRPSQLGAWASRQSAVVASREAMDAAYDDVAARFGEAEVEPPPFWGGYRVAPQTVEFWQGRAGRMHDRLRYRRAATGWTVDRLAP
jgi:pyridoxamine 5'-phosphate oxidase